MQLLNQQQKNAKELLEKLISKNKNLTFEQIFVEGYETVLKISHDKTKLEAIIAIHNTTLGPTLGGIRICPYQNFDEALNDVLRLSKGMTYKAALAGVGLGGGKSVIIAPPEKKTDELLFSFAEAVNVLQGLYICAEDMGCSVEEIKKIHTKTRFVTGVVHSKSSGDPGPFTAWGTFLGITSAVEKVFGNKSLQGKKVAIQGLGNVGQSLLEYLFWAGADLVVSDVQEERALGAAKKYGAQVVSPEEIMQVECDIFSPCAKGGILNSNTIPQLNCKIVAGAANNQLLKDIHADELRKRNILYAPDFVINAGGLINVACEIEQEGYNPRTARNKLYEIYNRLISIYEISEKNNISTQEAAVSLANYRIKYEVGKRVVAPVFHHGT